MARPAATRLVRHARRALTRGRALDPGHDRSPRRDPLSHLHDDPGGPRRARHPAAVAARPAGVSRFACEQRGARHPPRARQGRAPPPRTRSRAKAASPAVTPRRSDSSTKTASSASSRADNGRAPKAPATTNSVVNCSRQNAPSYADASARARSAPQPLVESRINSTTRNQDYAGESRAELGDSSLESSRRLSPPRPDDTRFGPADPGRSAAEARRRMR